MIRGKDKEIKNRESEISRLEGKIVRLTQKIDLDGKDNRKDSKGQTKRSTADQDFVMSLPPITFEEYDSRNVDFMWKALPKKYQ